MKRTLLLALTLLSATAALPSWVATRKDGGRPAMLLDGKTAQVAVDLAGGSIVDFHLKGHDLNPLTWDSKPGTTPEPRPRGHFLCFDRWGQPSDAEAKNGMPFHGEATSITWKRLRAGRDVAGERAAEMSATLPIAGLSLRRRIALSETEGLLTVRETVTNRNKLGRIYNMVQHPTIGPPFLDETTLVDAGAGRGFAQGQPVPDDGAAPVLWPEALATDGRRVDLRRLTDKADPGVASYVVDGPYGWITAVNPGRGLLLGYAWKRDDYGWIDAWRHVDAGKPFARGLEFGTTGLHQPFPVLVKQGAIFKTPIYAHIDAGESVTRTYVAFLVRVPTDHAGVAGISVRGADLVLHERGRGPERDLRIAGGGAALEAR